MDEYNISRKRDLELRANELGISISDSDYEDLDAVAVELSRLIELDDLNRSGEK
jgi:hypothetical protein